MKERNQTPIDKCPHCGGDEFFIRKDFPQKLGMSVVVIAGIAFLILSAKRETMYIGIWILCACVVLDVLLYFFVQRITVCYRCRAEFTGPLNPKHEGYELGTGEKYRQMKLEDERKK